MKKETPSFSATRSHRFTLGALLLSTVSFIFLNSLMTGSASAEASMSVYTVLDVIFGFFPFFTHTFVRSAAHFAEYALLGLLSFFAVRVFFGGKRRSVFLVFTFGLLTAVTDELLQLFVPGRVCSFFDLALDFCGFLFGVLVSFLFRLVRDKIRSAL